MAGTKATLGNVSAKVLDTKDRNKISDSDFAFPEERKLPIHDAAHVRNALARFNQTEGMSPEQKKAALARIHRAAKKFGIEVKANADDAAPAVEAVADVGDDVAADENLIKVVWIAARALELPKDDSRHPNRMPFKGILTRIGMPSDRPPHGSNGKRIVLTQAAAEGALDSLIGMGVNITRDGHFSGHDAQNKVGVITAADIDGDALRISGYIYSADFPQQALRIHLDQADLGFSFEARNLAVESMDADPLVIKSCCFTGASILLKSEAAYETTSLAAARAKEHEMDEVKKAVEAAIEAALGPVTKSLGDIAAAQAAQAQQIENLRRAPPVVQANAVTMGRVEPHAARLEAAADSMEQDGIGLHEPAGHAHHLRRMAHAMRADAAHGKIPHSYHDGASYFASGMPGLPQVAQMAPVQAAAAPAPQAPAPQKIEDSAEFKLMRASFEAELTKAKEDASVLKTEVSDLRAQMNNLRPSPQRKTITPEIQHLLARAGLTAPTDDTGTIPIGTIDKALSDMPGMSTAQRLQFKTTLANAGILTR